MPIDPSIALGVQPMKLVNPMEVMQTIQQTRAARAENEQRQFALTEARQKAQEDDEYKQAIQASAGMTPDAFLEHVRKNAPAHYLAVQKAIQEANDKAVAAKKSTAEAASAASQAALHQQAYIGHVADQLFQSDLNPALVNVALNDVVSHFPEWQGHADQLRQVAATQGKEALKSALQALVPAGDTKSRADAANAAAELPGKTATSAIQTQVAAGTVNGLTPEQQQQAKDRAATNRIAAGNLTVAQAREKREADTAAKQASDVTQLTPEGLDAAAMMFAKTGQLPALGMGDKGTRKTIINRAAALMPGLDIASAKADYGANAASEKNVTQTLDTLTAFETTAGKNLDQFLTLAAKVPDTGVPWINSPIRRLNANVVGSANQAAFNAARDVALREIARVTNDPKLSGVLSDSARHEVAGLSPDNATFAQITAVAKTLKQDMANVHSSLEDQRQAIRDRIKAAGPQTPSTKQQKPIPGVQGGIAELQPDGRWIRIK